MAIKEELMDDCTTQAQAPPPDGVEQTQQPDGAPADGGVVGGATRQLFGKSASLSEREVKAEPVLMSKGTHLLQCGMTDVATKKVSGQLK